MAAEQPGRDHVLAAKQNVDALLEPLNPTPAVNDMRAQLKALVYRGFVTTAGANRLPDLVRYLHGIARRLEKLPERPDRDADWMHSVHNVQREYAKLRDRVPPGEGLRDIRWMIEELRISYFAQTLGTPYPVSEKRIQRAMEALAPR